MRNNEAQRESRKRDKMDREMKQTKADLDAKNSEIKTMQTQIQRFKEDIGKLEQQLKEQRVSEFNPVLHNNAFWCLWNITYL